MSDYAAQRLNMVDSQIRTNDVTDVRVQEALRTVPRERFVPAARRAVAYQDGPLELVPGRSLMEPRVYAKLLQLAEIRPEDKALDVGCTTGYSTAVMARLASRVIGLEEDADLVRVATDMVPAVGLANVQIVQGALAGGHRAGAPYDVIFINGAIEQAPDALLAHLAEGGRLVAVQRNGTQGQAVLYRKEDGHVGRWASFDAAAAVLAGFRQPAGFVF
ncbi:MAG TPA: protein-L-isoaspartate O-methyltransferase [Rhizomicrobium sp.]|jgi:protein-L-isoaspartate(D-aspartate) O-methyltransferase|nr:protein-L-isoaspartate O-methyltransferase [Rhizomicrobium sp.]